MTVTPAAAARSESDGVSDLDRHGASGARRRPRRATVQVRGSTRGQAAGGSVQLGHRQHGDGPPAGGHGHAGVTHVTVTVTFKRRPGRRLTGPGRLFRVTARSRPGPPGRATQAGTETVTDRRHGVTVPVTVGLGRHWPGAGGNGTDSATEPGRQRRARPGPGGPRPGSVTGIMMWPRPGSVTGQ